MRQCPICKNEDLEITKLSCRSCGVGFEGSMGAPPLLRLSGNDLILAEQLILHGGNLKLLAETMGITYPTLRKRLDALMTKLKALKEESEKEIGDILDSIEQQKISPQEGIRRIKEIKGEA